MDSYKQIKKKQYYKLRHKWKQYKKEYNDLKLVFDKIGIEFVKSISKFCIEHDLGDPFKETEVETQNVAAVFSSSSKRLYRKIVVNTHPDRAEQPEKTKKIYNKATNAKKSGNLQELLDAGKEISLAPDINNITTEELDLLELNINEIKDKIQKIRNSYAWVWFHASPKKRNEIFYNFIELHAK